MRRSRIGVSGSATCSPPMISEARSSFVGGPRSIAADSTTSADLDAAAGGVATSSRRAAAKPAESQPFLPLVARISLPTIVAAGGGGRGQLKEGKLVVVPRVRPCSPTQPSAGTAARVKGGDAAERSEGHP